MGVEPFNIMKILIILMILVLIPLFGSFIASLTQKNKGDEYKKILGMDVILLIILILIQMIGPNNPVLLTIGSILILLAVFLEKSHLMRQYQSKPIIPGPYSNYDTMPEYSPTAYEWMLSIGSVGTCVLVSSVVYFLRNFFLLG
jgi:Ni/Fe-hydrogenase subunit HybB-like protein